MKRPENEVQAVEEIASEVYGWAYNAMGDLAGNNEILADEYWEDEAVLCDMMGDRIHDEVGTRFGFRGVDWAIAFLCVCEEIKKDHSGHAAMVKAMDRLIDRNC